MGKHNFCGNCGSPMVRGISTCHYGYDRQSGEAKVKRDSVWVCEWPLIGVQSAGWDDDSEGHDGWNYKIGRVTKA